MLLSFSNNMLTPSSLSLMQYDKKKKKKKEFNKNLLSWMSLEEIRTEEKKRKGKQGRSQFKWAKLKYGFLEIKSESSSYHFTKNTTMACHRLIRKRIHRIPVVGLLSCDD